MRLEIGHECLVVLAEESQFEAALIILNLCLRVGTAALGVEGSGLGDQSRDTDLFPGLAFRASGNHRVELPEIAFYEVVEFKAVFVERMRRKVHSHKFLFFLEEQEFIRFMLDFRDFRSHRLHLLGFSEKRNRRVLHIPAEKLAIADEGVEEGLPAPARGEELLF